MTQSRTSPETATLDAKTLLARINDWLREPDYAEVFSLVHLQEWMERRPISEVAALTAGLAPTPTVPVDAIVNLVNYQQQCDEDGVMVQVSRQALCEVLLYVTEVRPDNKWAVANSSTDRTSKEEA